MTNRQRFGDLSIAVLLALPLLALAKATPVHHKSVVTPAAAKVATADRMPGSGRISLF
jgi:hypothetical protein